MGFIIGISYNWIRVSLLIEVEARCQGDKEWMRVTSGLRNVLRDVAEERQVDEEIEAVRIGCLRKEGIVSEDKDILSKFQS